MVINRRICVIALNYDVVYKLIILNETNTTGPIKKGKILHCVDFFWISLAFTL